MLRVEMTPNLLGFRISGDYDALDKLYDAVWRLSPPDPGFPDDSRANGQRWGQQELNAGTRLLALCYDLRHAYQGSRTIETQPTGLTQEEADWHGIPLVENELIYSVEVLYPEAMYECMLLGWLISKRGAKEPRRQSAPLDKTVPIEGAHVALARYYQSLIFEAVGKVATKGRLSRIREYLSQSQQGIALMYTQWVDLINADYINMTRAQRAQSLSTVVRDLAEWELNDQCLELMRSIRAYAEQKKCSVYDVRLNDDPAYDEELDW